MADAFTAALKEAATYAPLDEHIVDTIEIRHASFRDANNRNTPVRVVADTENLSALLEATAPVDPSAVVLFVAFPFEMTVPAVEPGVEPELVIEVDDLASPHVAGGKRLSTMIEDAVLAGGEFAVIWRTFLKSNPAAGPQMRPYNMEVIDFEMANGKVRGRAEFTPNLESQTFPSEDYTAKKFPLLAALNLTQV